MTTRARIETAVMIVLTILTLAGIHFTVVFLSPVSRDFKVKTVMVEKGASFRAVASNLEKEGLIRDARGFSFAAKFLGAYKKIRAGEYELSPAMTPVAILDALLKGRVKRYQVTIPEGYNVRDAAAAIAATGLVDEKELTAKAMDASFAASLGIDGATLEGYLYPDTYYFERGQTVEDMLSMMAGRFKKVYDSEFAEEARQKGFSVKKLITLASIIEKETGAAGERPSISAVFQNRLKKRIRLQSDPTVIYGIKDFDGNLTKRHLQTPTPYNTYTNFGLPPGPIANPGKDAIRAAMNPADEEYLYFVSMNNGSHYFSKSLREHNNAVNTYQRKRGRKGV
ncbi:MAG: endolytic transglycosylase MltG [Deltaproteobacteria bacterium]|nr:endolytic transglycosylase MltG [Deltaproteobacteria bacterium]